MNEQRRKAIRKLCEQLEAIRDSFDAIMSEEQDAFDNMPQSLQESERGEKAQEAIDGLQSAYDQTDTLIDEVANSNWMD